MYAVSKQLINLVVKMSDSQESITSLATTMGELASISQEEQNLIFEMLNSSLSHICVDDKVKYPRKILKTKFLVLDNSPLIVTNRENNDKIKVFNIREQ